MGTMVSKVVFQPPPCSYAERKDDMNVIMIPQQQQGQEPHKIAGVYLSKLRAKWTILMSHGNAEDLGTFFEWAYYLSLNLDASIMAYDYSGYGLSEGTASEGAFYADADAAYHYLTDVQHVDPERIVVWGRSIGSAAAVHVASSVRTGGAILQCPVSSAFRIGLPAMLQTPTLPFDQFSNVDKISKMNEREVCTFVVHGRRDEIVPFANGELLYSKLTHRVDPWWIDDAGHNNIEALHGDDFVIHVRQFLDVLGTRSQPHHEPKYSIKQTLGSR